jgi:hypothetical protein
MMIAPKEWVEEQRRLGFTDEHIRRMIQLSMLQIRGLVRRVPLPDGLHELIFPDENHPDVRAFLDQGPCPCCGEPTAHVEQ